MAEDTKPSLEPQAADSDSLQQDSIPSPKPAATGTGAEVPSIPSLSTTTETLQETPITVDSTVPADTALTTEAPAETSADAAKQESAPSLENIEQLAATAEATEGTTAVEEEDDDTDFVPPDMEHIVSTGAAQDAASSMQALRELVAQARASSGQQREALPPGFGDDEIAEDTTAPQEQRGEKRKAEDELEELIRSSAGIDEVKAAAEQSQHPETKTLLQKALSSISGLVSRRPKADSAVSSPTATTSEHVSAAADAKSLADGDDADESDDDSSSDSGSSSSDSSDDDDDDDDENFKAAVALAVDDDDDEEGGGPSGSTAPVTKNEILAPAVDEPAIQELSDAEKQTLRKLGKVHSIVDSVVVVEQDVQQNKQADGASASSSASVPVDSTGRQGERQGEYSVLDTGSLLCFEDGKVLGLVFETFGSIHNPMYSIRFASAAAIDRELVKAGETVFYLPGQSTYVLTQLLRQMKGSDASNMWDEEVAEDEIDYSDDEQEAEAKRRAKAIRSGHVDDQGNPLSAPSARGNKRQKQHGADQPSNTAPRHPANGPSHQRPGHVGPGSNGGAARPNGQGPASLPRRSVGGPNLPLPPAPARSVTSGAALPQGIASLPPRPSAGLPSKPAFASDGSTSAHRPSAELGNGAPVTDQQAGSASRSRMGSTDSSVSGFSHSRMNSAAASSLPAKPVDAAAAAASASSPPRTNAAASSYGASSPPHAPRPTSMRNGPSAIPGAHHHQGSPAWYAGSPNLSAPAAGQSQYGVARNPTYSSGAGGPVAVQGGGHYNPAYAGHWQHSYGPTATPAIPNSPAPHAWNAQQSYHAAPMHMAPGAMSHQPYGSYGGGHAGYGAPPNASGGQGGSGNAWNAQAYPSSHYPGYTDQQHHYAASSNVSNTASHSNQGYYAPSAQAYAYGNGSYAAPDAYAYKGHGYGSSSSNGAAAAASTPQLDSYDPTSPSLNSSSGHGQNPHGASNS